MNFDEEEFSPYGGLGNGCDLHGEDFLRECTMCGIEFCAACFPHSALCQECAAQGEFDDDDEEPVGEDKDLLLLDEFNDDEPDLTDEEAPAFALPPPARSAATPKAPAPTRAAPKGKAKTAPPPKARPASTAKKPKAKAEAPRSAKAAKPKAAASKPKAPKAKAVVKAKARPASSKKRKR